MAENRGKQFESVIKESFERVDGVSIDRLHDMTNGYLGSSNIADYIVYKEPYEYYIECKSVNSPYLSIHSNDPKKKYGNISNKQWEGMLRKSQIDGVFAGVICWWVQYDITLFLPIMLLEYCRTELGLKSIKYDFISKYAFKEMAVLPIAGIKKRVFYDYDMTKFFEYFEDGGR